MCAHVCSLRGPEDSGRHFETVDTGGRELSDVVSGY